MTDREIQDAVTRELDWEPRVDSAQIGVRSSNKMSCGVGCSRAGRLRG